MDPSPATPSYAVPEDLSESAASRADSFGGYSIVFNPDVADGVVAATRVIAGQFSASWPVAPERADLMHGTQALI